MIDPEPVPFGRAYDRRVAIPHGDDGVTIDAGPDQPRWLTAVQHDLHVSFTATTASMGVDTTVVPHTVREVIFIGNTLLVTAPARVRRDDGLPSVVRVTDYQPGPDARVHNQEAA